MADDDKRGPGRPAHQPTDATRKTVEAMSGYGITQDEIGMVLGIDARTLRAHYRRELDLGEIKANSAVIQNLFRMATGTGREAAACAMFWAKTRCGWREVSREPDDQAYEKLGKKELAQRMAATAGEGTSWGNDLKFTGDIRPN